MELFIDRLPFTHLSVSLPILACEPGLASPTPGQPLSNWIVDTGFLGEAFAWRPHLSMAGLDPDTNLYHRFATLHSLTGTYSVWIP